MKYLIIIFFFLSCSSSRKLKTELHTVSKIDSVSTTHIDSSHLKKEISQDNRELTIEYDPSQTVDTVTSVMYGDAGIITIPTRGLKRINIKHSNATNFVNSMRIEIDKHMDLHSDIKQDQKVQTEKSNAIKLPSFNLWGTILGIGLPLLLGGGVWLFTWWKKRKREKSLK